MLTSILATDNLMFEGSETSKRFTLNDDEDVALEDHTDLTPSLELDELVRANVDSELVLVLMAAVKEVCLN